MLSVLWLQTVFMVFQPKSKASIILETFFEGTRLITDMKSSSNVVGSLECLRNWNIKLQYPIPVQVERFWSSDQNKESIQVLSPNHLIEKARESDEQFMLSGWMVK